MARIFLDARKFLAVLSKELLYGRNSFLGIRASNSAAVIMATFSSFLNIGNIETSPFTQHDRWVSLTSWA